MKLPPVWIVITIFRPGEKLTRLRIPAVLLWLLLLPPAALLLALAVTADLFTVFRLGLTRMYLAFLGITLELPGTSFKIGPGSEAREIEIRLI